LRELATIFLASFILALSGALMPGPLLTVTVSESVKMGFKAGPLIITGHALLELLLIIALVWGLGPFLKIPFITGMIALIGGVILFWMGLSMVRSTPSSPVNNSDNPSSSKIPVFTSPLLMGIFASLSNPYWSLWWATVGLSYLISSMKFGLLGIFIFFIGHISADYLWYILVSIGISKGKGVISDRLYTGLIRICGFFLMGFAGWFILISKKYLVR